MECLPCSDLIQLVNTLWNSLLDIDDLTASTNSILLLLAKLLSHPKNNKMLVLILILLISELSHNINDE